MSFIMSCSETNSPRPQATADEERDSASHSVAEFADGAGVRFTKYDAVRVDHTRRPYGQKTTAKRRRSRTGRQSALIAFPSPDAGFVVFLIAAATAGTQHSASASSSSSFSNVSSIVPKQHHKLKRESRNRLKLQTAASVDKAKMNKSEMNLFITTITAACT
ncbi:conserved hypothetical protein, partial [Trichinella spiralis]|uniref:hypothetical protein n=1 Tax=Trichinella spiralis TaxID=6334 RepID=UPI0001EFEE01